SRWRSAEKRQKRRHAPRDARPVDPENARAGPAHGHTIAYAIERRSDDALQVEHGSLYPALHRLEDRRWIAPSCAPSENNRLARYYRLTSSGRRQLTEQTTRWDELAAAINRILSPATE